MNFGMKDTKPIDELRQTVGEIAQYKMRNRLQTVQIERAQKEDAAIKGVLKSYTDAIKGKPTSHDQLVPNEQFGLMGIQSSLPEIETDPRVEKMETVRAHNDLMAIGTPKAQAAAKGVVDMYKLTRSPEAKTEFEAYLKMFHGDHAKAIDAFNKRKVADKIITQKKVAAGKDRALNEWDFLSAAAERDTKGNPTPRAIKAQRALDLHKTEANKGSILRTEKDAKGNSFDVLGYKDVDDNEIIMGYKPHEKATKGGLNINDPEIRKLFGMDEGAATEERPTDKTPREGQQWKVGQEYTDPSTSKKYRYLGGDKTSADSWEEIK